MAQMVTAEDHTGVAELLAVFARRAGHTVHIATGGPVALELVASCRLDRVIVDHQMPVTGLQVAGRLRAAGALSLPMRSAAAPAGSESLVDQVLTTPGASARLVETAQLLLDTASAATDPMTDPARINRVAELLDEPDSVAAGEAPLFTGNAALLLDADTAAINLALDNAVMFAAAFSLPPLLAHTGGVPAEWAPCTTVVRHGRPLLLTDTHTDPEYPPQSGRHPLRRPLPRRSAPARRYRHIVGTLCVMARGPYAFIPTTIDRRDTLTLRTLQHLRRRSVDGGHLPHRRPCAAAGRGPGLP